MEASLCLRAAQFATWRPEGLLAPNRHVAVVPNGRAIEMSPRHLVGALAQARQLTFGGGGWRRMDTSRRQLSSQAINRGDNQKQPSSPDKDQVKSPTNEVTVQPPSLPLNDGDEPSPDKDQVKSPTNEVTVQPPSLPLNDGDEPPTSDQLLDAMLRALLRILKIEELNNREHIIKEFHTKLKDIAKPKEDNTVYQTLLKMENEPRHFFDEFLTQHLIYEPHTVYNAWHGMKESEIKNKLGLLLARQLIYEKDYTRAMLVYEDLKKKLPKSNRSPFVLLFIICTSLGLDLVSSPREEILKYKIKDISIEG